MSNFQKQLRLNFLTAAFLQAKTRAKHKQIVLVKFTSLALTDNTASRTQLRNIIKDRCACEVIVKIIKN